jgi:hypothetical protein
MNGFVRRGFILLSLACIAVGLPSCNQEVVVVSTGITSHYPSTSHRIEVNSAGYGVFRQEVKNADIYLARVTSTQVAYERSIASGNATAGEEWKGELALAGIITTDTGEVIPRYERHWQVTLPEEKSLMMSQSRITSVKGVKEGDREFFYVDVSPGRKVARLEKIGKHCKIWVVEGYFGNGDYQVNGYQITQLANTFDKIYPLETALLGYEYGGNGGNGGVDGDPLINILVFDIDGNEDKGSVITLGYFYPGDEFQNGDTYPYSNEAEIFYLDVVQLKNNPTAIYSTLIHEFNHMINFGIKVLGGGEIRSWNTEVWYTEMLSMLAEDVIGPMVGILAENDSHVINTRIPRWLSAYADSSVMYWPSSGGNALPYYQSNYAFGAYLVRNFGGPALLSAIAKSSSGGRGSVDGALRLFNGMEVDTAYALSRFNEALLYSGNDIPEGVFSFDREVSGIIGGYPYTFYRFNIWNMADGGRQGPLIREYAKMTDYAAPANTVQLYTDSTWKNKTGVFEIYLRDVKPDALYYVMQKEHKSELE